MPHELATASPQALLLIGFACGLVVAGALVRAAFVIQGRR